MEKTYGVPLFVEEMTKAILESGVLRDTGARYELTRPMETVTIPIILHDSLMARLDQQATAKNLAQLGAVIGRQFSYGLIKALSGYDEGRLHRELTQLVNAELLYQRGPPPAGEARSLSTPPWTITRSDSRIRRNNDILTPDIRSSTVLSCAHKTLHTLALLVFRAYGG